jgi:hypothetical protein
MANQAGSGFDEARRRMCEILGFQPEPAKLTESSPRSPEPNIGAQATGGTGNQ